MQPNTSVQLGGGGGEPTKKPKPADGQCPERTAGNRFVVVVETKGSPAAHVRPWRRWPGVFRRGHWGCAMDRHHQGHCYFVLFPFLVQQSQTRWETKRLIHYPTPRILQQLSEMCPTLLAEDDHGHLKLADSTAISRVLRSGLTDLFLKINFGSNKTHGFDSRVGGRGSAGGCDWMTTSPSSLERHRSMRGGQSIIWTHTGATQTLKPALFSSILPGLHDCSPRACLFFLN